ncbi:MAG: serine/threonine-protein kinase, partial [Anaerolineales bacterium]
MRLPPMKKIGRYQVLREIGRGGMATVFLARDLFSGRRVAIKVLPPQFTHDPRFRAQFKREAKAIAALEHAYITPVYDFGEEENQPYIVMRYMPGGTLADRLVGQALPLEAIIPIVQRVAEGLDVAHRRSIIHRDLKPRNVLFDDEGQPFLSDFGVAKTGDGSATISSLGLFGTPAYISPEQADGSRKLDGRSDVYSLGVIVYEMLTGHRPFSAETPMGLMLKHATEPMPPIDTESLGLPAEVNAVLG